jgi:hypothetical protein
VVHDVERILDAVVVDLGFQKDAGDSNDADQVEQRGDASRSDVPHVVLVREGVHELKHLCLLLCRDACGSAGMNEQSSTMSQNQTIK